MQSIRLIERAYEHARSGEHRNVSDVVTALRKDGFARGSIEDHLGGKSVKSDLRKICREAQFPCPA